MRRAARNFPRLSITPDSFTSPVSGLDAAADAVHDGLGLLVYLLEHEMRIAALFELRDAHLQLLDVDPALVVVERDDLEGLVAVDDGDLAVVHVDEILRVLDDRRGVGAEESTRPAPMPMAIGLLWRAAMISSRLPFSTTAMA